jgi:hypothetical protein
MEVASSPAPPEFGRIAVVKKDGAEGAHFVITNNVLIGR